jgi:hypothetical protein
MRLGRRIAALDRAARSSLVTVVPRVVRNIALPEALIVYGRHALRMVLRH